MEALKHRVIKGRRIRTSTGGKELIMVEEFTPIYWGLFFEDEENIPEGTLELKVVHKHVTFGFKTPFPMELLGKESTVIVDGYGNDGKNEALFVELDPDIQDYHEGDDDARYHITLSVAEDGKPVDSGKLAVDPVERPYVLKGRFGYFAVDEEGEPCVRTTATS